MEVDEEFGVYPAKVFVRPNGDIIDIVVSNIYAKDAVWFEAQGVSISLEDCGAFNAIYASHPKLWNDDDSEPDEIVYIVPHGEACEDSLSAVRQEICVALEKRFPEAA